MPMLVALAAAACVWAALIVAGPLLPGAVAGPLYLFGSFICHQLPERSFHLAGAQLPVCARCAGIYMGGALSAVATTLLLWGEPSPARQASLIRLAPRTLLIVAALPTAVTVIAESAGWWYPSNAMRAAAGIVLGGGVAFAVMRAIHYERCLVRRRPQPLP